MDICNRLENVGPMTSKSPAVLLCRLIVFALALYYTGWALLMSDWGNPGGPLRYLTNWALFLSFFSAGAMLALSLGRVADSPRWRVLASVAAVANAVVVIQYWRLYFDDPANVNSGAPIEAWLEYYLHLLGPILQWIDALFLLGAFRHHVKSLFFMVLLVLCYALWVELFVGPMNDAPQGSVTSGLPYPFLNNMELNARLIFYGINAAVIVALYGAFVLIARFLPARA